MLTHMLKYIAFIEQVEKVGNKYEVRVEAMLEREWNARKVAAVFAVGSEELKPVVFVFTGSGKALKRRFGQKILKEDAWIRFFERHQASTRNREGDQQVRIMQWLQPSSVPEGTSLRNTTLTGKRISKKLHNELVDAFQLPTTIIDGAEAALADMKIARAVEALVVCNVGQGSSSTLLARDLAGDVCSQVQFDMGQGCFRNHFNAADIHNGLLGDSAPKQVVLSHWDADHYYAAISNANAQTSLWLAPRQPIGPFAANFAKKLHDNGKLLIWSDEWPADTLEICNHSVSVRKAKGKGRNDSGLYIVAKLVCTETAAPISHDSTQVQGSASAASPKVVLLPGDASFDVLKLSDNEKSTLEILVAPHHGAEVAKIPFCATGDALLVRSFGKDNSYGHPGASSAKRYGEAGWLQPFIDTNPSADGVCIPNLSN
jgi:hypothetical protein